MTYFGIKTHVKKIIALASKLDSTTLDERQLLRLLKALIGQESMSRIVPPLYRAGQSRFPDNPHFPYLEGVHLMGDDPDEDLRDYRVRYPLEKAAQLAHKRPPNEPGIKEMLADIERRMALLRVLNPFADAFSVLPGDVNGDGLVTTADIVDARNDQASLGGTYVVWADVNGDGVIDMNDLLEIRKRIGSKLP